MDPTFPLVPVANLLVGILVLISLIGVLCRPWNTGVCMFGIWTFLVAIETGSNTIIFADNVNNIAPVWCDISTHLVICSEVALPACSFVITRRLYHIACLRNIVETRLRKRMELALELFLCIGLPFIVSGLYYIIQAVRFEVVEELGCSGSVDTSVVTIIVLYQWHILFPSISLFFYSPRIILSFYRHRKELSEFLASNETVNQKDFYRIFALGCFDILLTLPLGIINIYLLTLGVPDFPFYSGWKHIHSDWGPILTPKSEWVDSGIWNRVTVYLNEWLNPFLGLLFFVIFGLTERTCSVICRFFRKIIRSPANALVQTSDIVFQTINTGQGTETPPSLRPKAFDPSKSASHPIYPPV